MVLKSILRGFFYLLYNPLAWMYDWIADVVSIGRWRSWIMTVTPYLKGDRILEIGHGPGHLQLSLQQKGYLSVGLDLSPFMSRLAYRRIVRNKGEPRLVNGKAQAIPFCSDSFDRVVATFPSEFIYDRNTLQEIKRVMTSEGLFIVLPIAWITPTSLPDRFASTLYKVTKQAPAWSDRILEPFKQQDFIVETRFIHLLNSRVVLILARKNDVTPN